MVHWALFIMIVLHGHSVGIVRDVCLIAWNHGLTGLYPKDWILVVGRSYGVRPVAA